MTVSLVETATSKNHHLQRSVQRERDISYGVVHLHLYLLSIVQQVVSVPEDMFSTL